MRRALQIGGLVRANLVAGRKGLDRIIRYVDIMEVPDAADWLRPDMLMITCAYAIKEDVDAQIDLVRSLSRCGASALAVKPARFLGSMPQGMIDAANEEGLPLIELPADLPYIEITHPLLSEILNEQVRESESEEDVFLKLTRLVLEQKGLNSVAATLCEGLRAKVYILDHNMHVLATSETGATGVPAPEYEMPAVKAQDAGEMLTVPIRSGASILGFVALDTARRGPLTPHEAKTLEQAAIVTGLEINRVNAVKETEMRLKADFFTEVLSGGASSSDIMAAKAKMLGIDVESPFCVMVVGARRSQPWRGGASDSPDPVVRARTAADTVRRQCTASGVRAVVLEFQDTVVAICTQQGASPAPEALATRIVAALEQAAGCSGAGICAGISRMHSGITSLATAYAEARRALDLGSVVFGQRSATSYVDLHPYLLLESVEKQLLRQFWEDQLGRLVDEDMTLVNTLRVFLDCGGEVKKASQALFIHRNTLDYRLRKIKTILGGDLRDPQTQFRLRLALLAGMVAGVIGGTQPSSRC